MLGERVLESQQPKVEPEPDGCQHKKAIEVRVGAGNYLVCECGHQKEV